MSSERQAQRQMRNAQPDSKECMIMECALLGIQRMHEHRNQRASGTNDPMCMHGGYLVVMSSLAGSATSLDPSAASALPVN
jgi:hypothetical protein